MTEWVQSPDVREFVILATSLWLERNRNVSTVSMNTPGELECELNPEIEVEFDRLPNELRKLMGDMAERTADSLRKSEGLIQFSESDLDERVKDLEAAAATEMTWAAYLQNREGNGREYGCVSACTLVCILLPLVYCFYKVIGGERVQLAEHVEEAPSMTACLQECKGDMAP